MFIQDPLLFLYLAIIIIVSVGLHEYAHAISSYKLGDPTPKLAGRLTPNPIVHIDIIGLVAVFIIGFGWGKPVEVNPYYYKKPIRDELIVALAGPATNLLLSIFGIILIIFYAKYGTNIGGAQEFLLQGIISNQGDNVLNFLMLFSFINIILAIFNMIPLPPLDGFRLIKFFCPYIASKIQQYTLIIAGFFILILLFGGGVIENIISTTGETIFKIIFKISAIIFG